MARWLLGKKIGRGGFCEVYDAWRSDEELDDQVGPVFALKRVQEVCMADEEVVRRFQREVRLLADTLRHPNIVKVVARNVTHSPPWFVMPKADGNLRDALNHGKAGQISWVTETFRQVLEGLAFAHGKQVIHRDLKPQNILMADGVPLIADFGLGKALSSDSTEMTRTNQWAGTGPYMAPEQFETMNRTDQRADVFSAGKLLYEMLTGVVPPVGVIDGEDLPEPFQYFVARCCDRKPENRYRDAEEALEAFDRVTQGPGAEPPAVALDALVQEWWQTPEGPDLEVVRRLHELLCHHENDEELFTREVPNLPQDLLHQYQDEEPVLFLAMMERYDRHVSGGLPFDYCDVVADFYANVWHRTSSLTLRRLLLSRLIEMGASHNRFHVGFVVSDLLNEISSPSTAEMASDVIRERPGHARWFAARVLKGSPPQPIRDAFATL